MWFVSKKKYEVLVEEFYQCKRQLIEESTEKTNRERDLLALQEKIAITNSKVSKLLEDLVDGSKGEKKVTGLRKSLVETVNKVTELLK